MEAIKNLTGGFLGALALSLLHETYRKIDSDAPRVALVGEEALSKSLESAGVSPPTGNDLYLATLAGDVFSNTLYYSLIGASGNKRILYRGAAYGLAAGIGAVALPKPMGLNDAPVTRSTKTRILTVAWYLVGGLAAATAIKQLKKAS
ncbi:MAG: hypothetical protein K0S09_2606 [Sphingobacteriaceae bacterium]|jgi:hypothetical protein|nr:hypothetical protein [Sphingobacteriaceae bacterium]